MTATTPTTRILGLGSLAVVWLLGWLDYNAMVAATGYTGISDFTLLVGIALCPYAGALAWVLLPSHRRARFGALAGFAMLVSYLAGSLLIQALNWNTMVHEPGGETPWSLLLEAWFWFGIPIAGSAVLGLIGWYAAAALAHLAGPRHGSR